MSTLTMLAAIAGVLCGGDLPAAQQGETGPAAPARAAAAADNPYNLAPFHPDFPVALEYPVRSGLEYDRTRRQMVERLVANLQGNVRREAWQLAMEFFWRAPEDAIEPLVAAMDRAFGNPALQDVVKNCVEAMGKMGDERFDAALQRALEHKNTAVRQAALAALARSGKTSTVRGLFPFFPQMDSRARVGWLQAARLRLGADAVPLLRELMMADFHSSVRDQVLKEALLMPMPQAAEILRGRWPEAIGEFKAIIAGVLHACGDAAGTTWLRDTLAGEDLQLLALAIRHSTYGELGVLRDSVLRHSSHPRVDIRYEVAKALRGREGDDIAEVYEVLSASDESWEVKTVALRELTRRGRPTAVGAMVEELSTATGTRLQLVLNLLAASGDGRAVPVFEERFRKAPPGEGRSFLQALGMSQSPAAADSLLRLFTGPVVLVSGGSQQFTTLNYIPMMLLNVRGAEARVVEAFGKLPREDWQRRATLLTTLAGMAADREDQAVKALCMEPVRAVLFDRTELPQMRVLALNLMTSRALTIDDALRLKNTRADEQPGLRVLFADFLNDFF